MSRDPATIRVLGVALMCQGQREAAESELATLDPAEAAEAYRDIAIEFYRRKLFDESEIFMRRAVTIRPGSAGLHVNLGCVLFEQDKLEEAVRSFSAAIDIEEASGPAWLYLGVTEMRLGRWELAEEALMRVCPAAGGRVEDGYRLDESETVRATGTLARVYLELARNAEDDELYRDAVEVATRSLRDVSDRDPDYPGLCLIRGHARHGLGEVGAAKADFRAARATAPHPSIERNAAERHLRRLKHGHRPTTPAWLTYPVAFVAALLIPYALIEAHDSASTVAGITLGALVMVIAAFSLPVLTKLRVGGVELELQSAEVVVRELPLNPERKAEFRMVEEAKNVSDRLIRSTDATGRHQESDPEERESAGAESVKPKRSKEDKDSENKDKDSENK